MSLGQLTHPRALADPFAAFAAVGREYGHPRRLMPFAESVERHTLRHERLQVVEPQDRFALLETSRGVVQHGPQRITIRGRHQAQLRVDAAGPKRLK